MASRLKTFGPLVRSFESRLIKPQAKRADPFYLSPQWRSFIAAVIKERGRRCEDPNCQTPGVTGIRIFGDHVVELSDGGAPFDRRNILLRCGSCHTRKTIAMRAKRMAAIAPTDPAAPHPHALERSSIPVTLVCGPPASGKSWFVQRHAGADDLVIDLDVIAHRISGMPLHGWSRQWLRPALAERNAMLAGLAGPETKAWPAAWLIVGEAAAQWRTWWVDRLGCQRVVVLETPDHICCERIAADPGRTHFQQSQCQDVYRWWGEYSRRDGDDVIDQAGGLSQPASMG